MLIERREMLRGGLLLAGTGLLPSALCAAPAGKRYGMIEISASGMTVSVYQLSREMLGGDSGMSGFERLAPKRDGEPYSVLASPLESGTDEQAAIRTVDLVADHIARLKADRGVADQDLTIVASSGVASFSAPLLAIIRDRLAGRTGHRIDVVSPRDEARLAFDWIVPRRRRGDVLQLDIGSGNTKGGYYDRRGRNAHYIDMSVPYGTKTMAGAVKFRFPAARTYDFGQHADSFYADTVAPLFQPQLQAAPATMSMPSVFLTGGIVWATSVILYPQAMAERRSWVALQPGDFARLGKLIADGTPYGAGLPATLSPEHRAVVTKTLSAIRNTFNPHQLAAGASLADGVARQFDFARRRTLLFPTFANNGWISQYLIEKFVDGRIAQVA
ncbi:hypothetical protein COO09_11010 [Rhizorhabdus dicambivorans]|uniref:Ppx/GppA phosphatase domain-containing protein n=2 Tax=Rhizorhabdus dicambivorans TaxID=1850238 RepID=A0A2A4FXG4_9SPHN|nr:hypothetical protein CMV14_23280 [Rhizorhabdus dicambivorans]PCE42160.1 hypothetical protein COO09_11010 [Rhizorhabdus dicambivorans]